MTPSAHTPAFSSAPGPVLRWLRRGLLALGATASLLGASSAVRADDGETGYSPPRGAPFFLLTDMAYSPADESLVRMEVQPEALSEVADAGGADIALYKVERPLDFLRQQRNLHRIDLAAVPRKEGLANTLSYVWSQWWLRARQSWQNIFDGGLRRAVTTQAPALRTAKDIANPPAYTYRSPFRVPPGMQEVSRMRYPVQFAKPIAPPADLKLAGSSSEFRPPQDGNVLIPLGHQAPGLYVVEAVVGRHRAVALLFVSDTVAVTKTSSDQLLLWAAQRGSGRPAVAEVVWSDLAGVLGTGRTDSAGVLSLDHAVPQTSYAFGQDAQGGVFITENFYYDSEIYNSKLYAYTERPLYRPGDEVNLRVYGREFSSATRSKPLAAGPVELRVFDATGALVQQQTLAYHPQDGASTRFVLPDNAPAGGYEIRLKRGEDEYAAAFRVAPYVKPHFEVLIEPAKPSFKTGEAPGGRIRLAYPDGRPVANAALRLSARSQVLSMVEGDLAYGSLFPVEIAEDKALVTDAKGEVSFKLPAAKEPSRLVLSVLATDGAAQRVKASKELLVERAAAAWQLTPERRHGAAKEAMRWRLQAEDSAAQPSVPTRWVAIHQESQTRQDGALPAGAKDFSLALTRPGSYTVELRDAQDNLLGAAPFWVAGDELKPPQGAVEIVFDKPRYRAGDTARALITFPVKVEDALLTLERDRVEAYARLAAPGRVAEVRRLGERQWEARVPVTLAQAPNITFSVAYVNGHEFGFQNAGIVVEQPALQLSLQTDKPSYQPGETVTVDITSRDRDGRPMPAVLSLGVVDEMVYALQPELAPSVNEFFYHLRRNNVRTQSSLSFISFDEASDVRSASSAAQQRNERGVKLLERPRRDDRDTAFFAPALHTDANGHVQVRFKLPDALTRWRLTAKAYGVDAADGLLGEKRAFVLSDKPFFAKWTAPTWLRQGDKPQATLAVFNQGSAASTLKLTWSLGKGPLQSRELATQPGANFAVLDLPALTADTPLEVNVQQNGRTVDSLVTTLTVLPQGWRGPQEKLLPIEPGSSRTALDLPADARQLRLRVMGNGAATWSRVADSLIDYPYGCVEQTASRLIPLAMAVRTLGSDLPAQNAVRQRLYSARLRLASMAGPDAVFGWWGRGTDDSAFLSAYAYHADWLATQALGIELPAQHWERLLDIYAKQAPGQPLSERAWTLWLMGEIGLPTKTLVEGLVNAFAEAGNAAPAAAAASGASAPRPSASLPASDWYSPLDRGQAGQALGLVLAARLAQQSQVRWPAELNAALDAARAKVAASSGLLAQVVSGQPEGIANALLRASEAAPTIDRALSLAWLARQSGLSLRPEPAPIAPQGGFSAGKTASGQAEWMAPAGAAPAQVDWSGPAPAGLTAVLRWQGLAAPSGKLPVQLTRKLYRLERQGEFYTQVAVDPRQPLSSEALYLDELTLSASQALNHALVEVALPPGAFMDPSTWGIRFSKDTALAEALGEARPEGYVVPVDALAQGGKLVVGHLVRFGQKGSFQLPPARVWRMYQPGLQASETGATAAWQVR
jgi:uncharacterized protein YfaS (alpha-2-macroglobulin family)